LSELRSTSQIYSLAHDLAAVGEADPLPHTLGQFSKKKIAAGS